MYTKGTYNDDVHNLYGIKHELKGSVFNKYLEVNTLFMCLDSIKYKRSGDLLIENR